MRMNTAIPKRVQRLQGALARADVIIGRLIQEREKLTDEDERYALTVRVDRYQANRDLVAAELDAFIASRNRGSGSRIDRAADKRRRKAEKRRAEAYGWGVLLGTDVQHLRDDCWGYEGEDGCEGKACRRCGGTGVWSERWIWLERIELGARVFHRQNGFTINRPTDGPVIEGRIKHDGVSYGASTEAQLWLALLFDRRLLWKLLRGSRTCGWQWRPMKALQVVVFTLTMLAARAVPCRCWCGRWFVRGFDKGQTLTCRRCSPRGLLARLRYRHRFAAAANGDDDLPF